MKYPFLKEKDNKAIFTGNQLECYIPQSFFDKGMTSIDGEYVSTLGVFNLRATTNDKQDITKSKLLTFGVPTMVTMKPTSIEKRELNLLGTHSESYTVLTFFNGDELLTSLDVVATVDNTELFMMKLLTEGKLPSTIKYTDVFLLYLKNLELNGMNLESPGSILSIIASETYRYKGDNTLPLRKVLGKGKCGELDYVTANMRSICSLSSTFSALTFEDIDAMIIQSVNRKRYNYNNAETPLESIID